MIPHWIVMVIVAIVAFFVLRGLSARYFGDMRRSDLFALLVVGAFYAGAWWPPADRRADPPLPAVESAAVVPAAQPSTLAVAASRNVRAVCAAAGRIAPASATTLGRLDVVGDIAGQKPEARESGFTIDRAATLMVQGWAADSATKSAADAACLLIDGKLQKTATAIYGRPRPDVAAAFQTAAMTSTGFMITLPVAGLGSGTHEIGVAVVTPAGAIALATKATVIVP